MSNTVNKKLRVLIVNKYYDIVGGVEESVRQLATINESDLEITVLVQTVTKDVSHLIAQFPHIKLILLPITFTALRMPVSLHFFRRYMKELRKTDVLHIHSPFPLAEWFYIILNWFTSYKCKLIMTWHTDVVNQKLFIRIHHWFLKRLFKISSYIAVTSPAIISGTKVLQPFKEKVIVVPLGVYGLESKPDRSYDKFTFALFAGRLIYYKGLSTLLDALTGTEMKLVIVGRGPLYKELRKKAKDLGIESQLTWRGQITDDELKELYKSCSLLTFPSVAITEAFGLVQAEAMSYGLPIINTDLPTGVPWVARNNIEAITVPVENVEELHNALVDIYKDSALREQLGKNGRKRFEEMFTVDKWKSRYVELYRSLR